MLPKSHQENLSTWLGLLTTFQFLLNDNHSLLSIEEKWQEIYSFFHSDILPLTDDNLDGDKQYLFRSWQTEANRYLRLLQTDILFYRSAKQITTKQSRFSSLKGRINDIINLTNNYLQK